MLYFPQMSADYADSILAFVFRFLFANSPEDEPGTATQIQEAAHYTWQFLFFPLFLMGLLHPVDAKLRSALLWPVYF